MPDSKINRFSSRLDRLDTVFLGARLKNARSYKRIAGYFRSSIFELVGEQIESVPKVQIVCNSELDASDILISKAARDSALKERWNDMSTEVEALMNRDRYKKLYQLLTSGSVEVRVVPKDKVFLHGKAGVIEMENGLKTSFLGSINETRSAFAQNYEILWEDESPEGVAWVEEEFDALWKDAIPLPNAIIEEVKRISERVEVRFEDLALKDVAAAALAESPIYRAGEQLQPWQRAFVTIFLHHREIYGRTRVLLADEVGVGKTLSLAASALVASILGDGPVLILCPATLTLQWQVELKDRLGIPSAVWLSNKKVWMDPNGHIIKTRGAEDINHCPFRIAIVSTGLITQPTSERGLLLKRSFGTVILDEAHKARKSGGPDKSKQKPNNLLDFMLRIGPKTKNLLLGTATPIQTDVAELWDLMKILNAGCPFVLGNEIVSNWADPSKSLPVIKGEASMADISEVWEWLRNPLPPVDDDLLVNDLRMQLGVPDKEFFSAIAASNLDYVAQTTIEPAMDPEYFRNRNPILRHTVLRKRSTLEEQGLLEKIAVEVHPVPEKPATFYPGVPFVGLGLMTNHPFDLAYEAAKEFTALLKKRVPSAGFMKTLMLQRICSSFASARATASGILHRSLDDSEEDSLSSDESIRNPTDAEKQCLQTIVLELSRPEARDPKLAAVRYFLTEHRSEGRTWLEHGSIIFSQYYDTAKWVASQLALTLPGETIAVYAGAGKSGLFKDGQFVSVEREDIKTAVRKRTIRLVAATDAACEGLNLQTLGTLINIDLPWNPSRLEQRLGRIKRFGQKRKSVDMLNLVYHETQDEKIYQVLSKRLKDKHDIFGGLPDTIEDDWIEDIEHLEEQIDGYMHMRDRARNAFEVRYEGSVNPDADRWELCSRVLSRKDVVDKMSESW